MKVVELGKVALFGLLAVMLAACASEQAKEAPAVASAPVPVAAATPKPVPLVQPVVPRPVPVNPLADPKSVLAKRSVFYGFDTYSVTSEYRPMVEAHAAYVRQHPGASVTIEGNCDERGSREYNLALGQRRADGVKNLMVLLGASERQIETVSFGEEKPRAAGHDETAWAQNRRSDILYKREQ